MQKYRIKEEKYKSGKSKFFPQFIHDDGNWISLSMSMFGLNTNGYDWCSTYDESILIIDRYKMYVQNKGDEILEEKIYEVN